MAHNGGYFFNIKGLIKFLITKLLMKYNNLLSFFKYFTKPQKIVQYLQIIYDHHIEKRLYWYIISSIFVTLPLMSLNSPQELQLAVLIDADNVSATYLEEMMGEIATLGRSSVRRAYGDWTKPQSASWKNVLLPHSIQPIQQFAYTTGKNATDASLIIDAMDLMYTGRFDGFCLVSSDSDYTRLAQRLREQGIIVYGFGKNHTPKAFVQACDRFIYLEMLELSEKDNNVDFYDSADLVFTSDNHLKPIDVAIALVKQAIDSTADEQGWANIAPVKNYILKVEPDFDSRLFNYNKFSDFLRAYERYFELEERYPNGDTHKVIFVKNRNADEKLDGLTLSPEFTDLPI